MKYKMEINKLLHSIFLDLSKYETMKGRDYPAMTFIKVADRIKIMTEDIVSHTQFYNIKYIGKSSIDIIEEVIKTGQCERHNRVLQDPTFQSEYQKLVCLESLQEIPGIGPAIAEKLYLADFKYSNEIIALHLKEGDPIGNSGVNVTHAMYVGMEFMAHTDKTRMTQEQHDAIANPMMQKIQEKYPQGKVACVGSRRREKETIGDIDIIVATENGETEVTDFCASLLDCVVGHGATKVAGIKDKRHVDFRIVPLKYWGSMLLHGTGSADFNRKMRIVAIEKNMSLSEYGLRDRATGNCIVSETEEEIFKVLGVPFVPPKERY